MNQHSSETDHQLDTAWGIIANAHGGDWSKASDDWQEAATRWRDEVLPGLSNRNAAAPQGNYIENEPPPLVRLPDSYAHALLGHTVAPDQTPQFVYSINRIAEGYATLHSVDLDTAREAVWSQLVTPISIMHGHRAPLFLDDAIADETKPEPSLVVMPPGVQRPRL